MKKSAAIIFTLASLFSLSACAASETAEFTPDYESAIGVIFVNSAQELPENEKIYAAYADHNYTFDLDAACIYYFNASAEEAYAGDQNLTELTFGANLDDDTVGAEGTIAYDLKDDSENSVTAHYLYHDEKGVYFDTETYFDAADITDGCSFKGIDYPSFVTFTLAEPAAAFTITEYDESHHAVSEKEYTPAEVTDYQAFEMGSGISSAEVTGYAADGTALDTQTVTPENNTASICFDAGGQILGNRILRFAWEY